MSLLKKSEKPKSCCFSNDELKLLQIAVEDMYVNVQHLNLIASKSIPLHECFSVSEEEFFDSCRQESSLTAKELLKIYQKICI